jgi:hypothetical protein
MLISTSSPLTVIAWLPARLGSSLAEPGQGGQAEPEGHGNLLKGIKFRKPPNIINPQHEIRNSQHAFFSHKFFPKPVFI